MACQADTKEGSMRKGPWLEEEDEKLASFVTLMGERRWDSIARVSGLQRSGKSCRLRWLNYLRPNLKHGQMSAEEELLILELHKQWGNKWSKIARSLPGRTDNEIKNYWRTHLRKKVQALEQEKLQKEIRDAISKVQDFLMQEGNQLSSQMDSYDSIGSCEKNTLMNTNSVNGFGSSDCSFSVSPYETRLHNCLSESSHNYGVEFKEIEESHATLNTCICNSTWTWGDNDSMWDSHYKLEGSFF